MPVLNRIADFHDEMTAWRRDFHMHPELGFEEVRTSGIVAEKLKGWGIETHTGIATTGVVGVIRGNRGDGPTIGLRADMDALPMQEENEFGHKSLNPGKMHGCGHDGHTTMLLGAARYLAETRNFRGSVVVIFQPAEEGGGGGRRMVEEGLFDRFPCDQVYGMHNWPQMPFGTAGIIDGPIMAAADLINITVRGTGAHAAMPHLGIDPVVVASHIVTALQTLVSRTTDPLDSAVISVTKLNAGSAHNVIADNAVLGGTVRTFKPATRDAMEAGIRRVAENVAMAFGASAEVEYRRNYPPTINEKLATETAARAATRVVGEENVLRDLAPSMGGEDFAFMLEAKPGNYIWLGQAGGPSACNVHNPKYDFNDALLPLGASYWAALVEETLGA
ncbi:M20 aminoacylase family protein [Radicibacter daui]|uniref:M20 aminoacylase family protein n=1 Tax=Radicibacter daui TaxID=3064829 RepID=UPI004046A9CC